MQIRNVLEKLNQQNKIDFSYKSDLKSLNKRVTINENNIELKKLLSKLFAETDIRFIAYEEQIILIEKKQMPRKIYIQGIIYDQESNEVIPYSTVVSLTTGEGVICDINGKFEIETDDRFTNDSLKFSSYGYEYKIISMNEIKDLEVVKVKLERKILKLEQVDVLSSNFKTKNEGNKGLFTFGAVYMDTNGQQIALFIENSSNKEGLIESVSFKLSPKGNVEAPFRVRLYYVDTITGRPLGNLLKELLVVKPNIEKGWFKVNLSEYRLTAPAEGFFVAMEGVFPNDFDFYFGNESFVDVSENNNNQTDDNSQLDISYGQRLCYNRKLTNNTWHYSLSHKWFQLQNSKFNVMITANILYRK